MRKPYYVLPIPVMATCFNSFNKNPGGDGLIQGLGVRVSCLGRGDPAKSKCDREFPQCNKRLRVKGSGLQGIVV